ncbi:MAG: guanylate kinase [Gammaproteobacteria bacterium]|nr:guanylate kinase [Gammaproteobacteria bacterium]
MGRTGRLYILSAASGAGKTTLAKALADGMPNTRLSISHTTRPRRPGEREAGDYYFVDKACFNAMIERDEFLEYAKVFDHMYGTSKSSVEDCLAAGCNVVLDIDWQGARVVRNRMPDACGIFVMPPSRQVLEQRLRNRGQDSDAVITRRMRDAVNEMRHYEEYDYVVVNDDFEQALQNLKRIVSGLEPLPLPPTFRIDELVDPSGV